MSLKAGVRIQGVSTELTFAMWIVAEVFRDNNIPLVVTSCVEGTHTRGSEHYQGNAIDLRTRDMPADKVKYVRDVLAQRLGADFQILVEKDHLHVGYFPTAPIAP
jgi:hypothetical protein